jgi:thioredoxin reductase (NADPH)
MSFDADVAIIGAGPLGVELAAALKLSGISYLLFDKEQLGQMIFNFPPQTHFFSSNDRISIAGIPIQTLDQQKCTREEYLAYLRTVVGTYGLQIHPFEEVLSVTIKDGFILTTPKKTYRTRFVVVATGSTSRPRLLKVPGESLPHVYTKMVDPHLYFQQKVVVIGGKNSAVETAIRLSHAGAHPHLILRKPDLDKDAVKYWLFPELEGGLKRGEILMTQNAEVIEITPSSVKIRDLGTQQVKEVAADCVIKAIGFEADMSLLQRLGVELITTVQRPAFDDATMETKVPNLFVLGTIVGGTQRGYRVFIENSHQHVGKILSCIANRLNITPPHIDWVTKKDAVPLHLEQ